MTPCSASSEPGTSYSSISSLTLYHWAILLHEGQICIYGIPSEWQVWPVSKLTLWWNSWNNFLKKLFLKNKSTNNKMSCNLLRAKNYFCIFILFQFKLRVIQLLYQYTNYIPSSEKDLNFHLSLHFRSYFECGKSESSAKTAQSIHVHLHCSALWQVTHSYVCAGQYKRWTSYLSHVWNS